MELKGRMCSFVIFHLLKIDWKIKLVIKLDLSLMINGLCMRLRITVFVEQNVYLIGIKLCVYSVRFYVYEDR